MSRQGEKLLDRPQPRVGSGRARAADAGIARGPGIVVAVVTAAIVFVIGQQLFPVKSRQAPPAPVAANPPPVTPPPAIVDAEAQAPTGAAEAGTATAEKAVDASPAAIADAAPEKAEKTEKAEKPTAAEPSKPAADSEAGDATADHKPSERQDKDLAREAWRRNRPDISIFGNKTAIMVPIRGSIRGASFKVFNKPRSVLVTLPKAVSMVTLRVYNMKHPLFRKVWIDQDEANAQPDDGTKLRFVLSPQTYDPQVEITDDFVRVTIRRPESGDGASERTEKRAEKRERPEKRSEPAEEAPAPEKESSD